jgi:2-hydroxychromene-2-carboxylate isomerase
MRNRTRVIAATAAVSAALAAGGAVAVASTAVAKPGTSAKTVSATEGPRGSRAVGSRSGEEQQGHEAIVAAVAQELHLSTAQVIAALRPLFAAGQADTSSPAFAAAANSLGVTTQQLAAALTQAKQSVAGAMQTQQKPGGSKAVGAKTGGSQAGGSKSGEEQQGHDAIAAAVAQELHVSTAQASAALQPLFAAGQADTSSPAFAAAARSLGVSTQQLAVALAQAKQSLAQGN